MSDLRGSQTNFRQNGVAESMTFQPHAAESCTEPGCTCGHDVPGEGCLQTGRYFPLTALTSEHLLPQPPRLVRGEKHAGRACGHQHDFCWNSGKSASVLLASHKPGQCGRDLPSANPSLTHRWRSDSIQRTRGRD